MASVIRFSAACVIAILHIAGAATAESETHVVTFDNGLEGWQPPAGPGGSSEIEPAGGNPGANLRTVFNNFLVTWTNTTNPAFVQDFSQYDRVTFSIDVEVLGIEFFGTPVTRPWLVEIRDYDNPPDGYPWVSVWYLFKWTGEGPWTTWSVSIEDPSAEALPPGWGGTGAVDPGTFEPMLPPDRTFTDVLAGADALVFTTGQPGYVFGFTDFDLRLDNITVTTELNECRADLNQDGTVDGADLGLLLVAWGDCPPHCPADLNDDGRIDGADMGLLLSAWDGCP